MRYIFCLLFLLFSSLSFAAQVLVIVDGKAITSVDVEKRLEALRISNPELMMSPEIKAAILNNLISEELFHNEAKRLKISVTDEEVDDYFKAMQQDYHLSNELLQKLKNNSSFYQQAESQVLWNKLIGMVLYSKVKVSDAEVRDEQKVREFETKDVTFKQIVFSSMDTHKIEKLKTEAQNCQHLNQLAKENDLNTPYQTTVLLADLNPDLQNIIKTLPENKLSDIVTIQRQKQVIMVCHKNMTSTSKNAKLIRQELGNRKINAEAQKYLAELKKRVYIEFIAH